PRQLSDQQLSRLDRYVTDWLGLHFPRKRWHDLERIVLHAAPELGFRSADECIERLVSGQLGAEQKEILASHLTIGETYFFREPDSFAFLESHVLPGLIASRRGRDQRLRIWSAGCSTGEEPYSLAILLNRLLPDIRDWQITILATDINTRALARASHGVYREWSFRGVPDWIRERYFTRTSGGRFELPYSIRKMVTFAVLNLAEDSYPSLSGNTNAMDIIFCRNVLMYFEPGRQQQAIRGFHRSLLEGGWLFVSPCEASPVFSSCFGTVMFPGGCAYHKGNGRTKPHGMTVSGPAAAAPVEDLPVKQVRSPAESPQAPPVPRGAPTRQKRHHAPASPGASPYEDALALYRLGSYAEAADLLAGFLERPETTSGARPLFGKAAVLLAHALANQGRIELALEWTGRAIAIDKLNAELYYLRATLFQERGAEPQAIASLRQALYLDQNFVLAHFALGTLTLRQGKFTEALRHFDNALSLVGACPADAPLPGGDGMTAGRLSEIIASTRESMRGRDTARRRTTQP
ncbi:MAG TPA: CheR family methyltransferase, partial [Desulfuromonadaceae bacterium]